MKQDYKEELYLQFYYGECDLFERLEIENELETNVRAITNMPLFTAAFWINSKPLAPNNPPSIKSWLTQSHRFLLTIVR